MIWLDEWLKKSVSTLKKTSEYLNKIAYSVHRSKYPNRDPYILIEADEDVSLKQSDPEGKRFKLPCLANPEVVEMLLVEDPEPFPFIEIPGRRCEPIELISSKSYAQIWKVHVYSMEGDFYHELRIKIYSENFSKHLSQSEGYIKNLRSAAMLEHLNIPQIFELSFPQNSRGFVLGEWISGHSLRYHLDLCQKYNLRFPLEQSCYIVSEIAKILLFAKGGADSVGNSPPLPHGNLCPEHIIISQGGKAIPGLVKVIGFGDGMSFSNFHSSAYKGHFDALEYFSPEQQTGLHGSVSDIFSLGLIFYELLTGHAPRQEGSPIQLNHFDLRKLDQYLRLFPTQLQKTLRSMLAPTPQARFNNLNKLKELCDSLLPQNTEPKKALLRCLERIEMGLGPEQTIGQEQGRKEQGKLEDRLFDDL